MKQTDNNSLSSCQGKEAFASFSLAQRIANRSRKQKLNNVSLRPYFCKLCRRFHLGNGKGHNR